MGEDAFERWYFQEHGEDMARIKQKEEKRRERRAAFEERQQKRRAGMNSEALANLQNKIAKQTKEERQQEERNAVAQRKRYMAAVLRNRLNGSEN